MKRYYLLPLDGQSVALRLTIAGQRALQQRFDEEALQTVLLAATDAERMSALLDAALHWAGNNNPIQDGEALYDLLVDEGWSGADRFSSLAFDIAVQSGLLNDKQAQQLKASVQAAVNSAFQPSAFAADTQQNGEQSAPFVQS